MDTIHPNPPPRIERLVVKNYRALHQRVVQAGASNQAQIYR